MQTRQAHERVHQACRLAQGLAKQVLEGQAKLDGGIRELGAATAFAAGGGKPGHAPVEPVGRAVTAFGGGRSRAHLPSLQAEQ